uniref:Uncharacterized protein n=2 Tax=Oryza TaxID=4527 RepID=Q10CE3_ORYSJ|nr:hypothetical protein LOC_Os03g57230 [Oryza sativa Japonica Group]
MATFRPGNDVETIFRSAAVNSEIWIVMQEFFNMCPRHRNNLRRILKRKLLSGGWLFRE